MQFMTKLIVLWAGWSNLQISIYNKYLSRAYCSQANIVGLINIEIFAFPLN